MNTTLEHKSQTANQRAQQHESQSAKAYPSRTIVHAKLEMTEPGDHDEREADAIANTVMSGGKIARKISSGGSGSSGIAVSSQMESQLNHLQGGGQAMPEGLRSMMESGFGQDFGQVRLHTDSEAASMSSSIHAKAFTHGNDIYFNQGQFSPNTSEGQHLVAHELTHVVQGNQKISKQDDEESYEACMSNARIENCNYSGFDVCTPLDDTEINDIDKYNCNIAAYRIRAKTELGNLKNAFTNAIISIMIEKNKPKMPVDILFHIAEDVLGAIPVVGGYLGKMPKYVSDIKDLANYEEDINYYTAQESVRKHFHSIFDNITTKIYSSKNEDELREIAIILNQESCKGDLTEHYKKLIEDKIKDYTESVQPLGLSAKLIDKFFKPDCKKVVDKIDNNGNHVVLVACGMRLR